jgi:hypothetical protein
MRAMGKQKAVALWTKRSEGVGGRRSKHRGRLRKCAATCRNKWQQKWLKKAQWEDTQRASWVDGLETRSKTQK